MKLPPLWPIAIAGVLGITVVANGFLLYRAADADATAVELDYYRKALSWDSTMAQAERNTRLAWRIEGRLEQDGVIDVRLTDPADEALGGAVVEVEGFALARATVYRHTLAAQDAGRYTGRIPEPHGGLHELRFTVRRGTDRFTAVLRASPGNPLTPRA